MMAAVVAAMTLGELLGPSAGPMAGVSISDLVADSRSVTPGAGFVALQGETSHGLDFADQAVAAGAAVILFDPATAPEQAPAIGLAVPGLAGKLGELGRRFYGRDRKPDGLIGVTGTNGKTTVAWLIAEALSSLESGCGYIGTLGYGTPVALKRQALTTPDCLRLHRELAEIGPGCTALEVSSQGLAQDRIAGLGFDVAVFTNLSHDHLDLHGSMEAYFEAKALLFDRALGAAVINIDDAYGRRLTGRLKAGTKCVGVSLNGGDGDLIATFTSRGLAGLRLAIEGRFGSATLESKLIGDFNAENLALATAAVVARGHGLGDASQALAEAAPPPGRMESFGGGSRPRVIVDYAHTPDALRRALSVVAASTAGSVTCVFGCGGDRDRDKRPLMGAAAAEYAGRIVLTDDNPRSEDPAGIIAAIQNGIPAGPEVRIEHDRRAAIADAIEAASADDAVLVAGRGHETLQLIGTESRPFDDRAVVRAVLEGIS